MFLGLRDAVFPAMTGAAKTSVALGLAGLDVGRRGAPEPPANIAASMKSDEGLPHLFFSPLVMAGKTATDPVILDARQSKRLRQPPRQPQPSDFFKRYFLAVADAIDRAGPSRQRPRIEPSLARMISSGRPR